MGMTFHRATRIDLDDPVLDRAVEILDDIHNLPIGQDRSFFAVVNAVKADMPELSDARAYEVADWATVLNAMTQPPNG